MPLIPPEKNGLIDVPNIDEIVWYHGRFGGNGFGFFGTGRLGISDMAVTLSGHMVSPIILRFINPLFSIMLGIGYMPLILSISHFPLALQYAVVILYLSIVIIIFLVVNRIIRHCFSSPVTIALNRFTLKRAWHKRNKLILDVPDKRVKLSLCVFVLQTLQEAEALAAELTKTAQG